EKKSNRKKKMEKKSNGESDVNGKWDACIDLTARRVVCSSLGGAFAGLLFFSSCVDLFPIRITIINFHAGSPVTRWASTAFGAGIGIGSAYADCSRFFDSSSSATSPKSIETSYFVCLSLLLYALDCVWESLLHRFFGSFSFFAFFGKQYWKLNKW
ncbi:LOW QUALITY PROTEIN: hypothetical protein HID58_075633, partial [Brassica napus]